MKQTLTAAAENYIRHLFTNGTFPAIDYDREGAREMPQWVSATSCEVGEEECNFAIDKMQGMAVNIKPLGWTLIANVAFPKKIDLHQSAMEHFGQQIRIPSGDDYPTFRITLLRYSAQHPARREAAHGTLAKFTFQIDTIRGK